MRLKPADVDAIKDAAREAFGSDVVVRLFGSRVHDHLRGGDIDLHFEVTQPIPDAAVDIFEDILFRSIDPQRVDKIFSERGAALSPFERIAYRDGIIL